MTFQGIDEEAIDSLYEEVKTMMVMLDPDPLRYGPERLNNKTAETQNYLSRVERILTQIVHDHHIMSRRHLALEADLDLQTKDLIAHDAEVRSGSSYKDRIARAHMKLHKQFILKNQLHGTIHDLEIITEVLKAKRSELKNIQQRLKDQFRICQEEISLNARWGHPRGADIDLKPAADYDDMMEVHKLIAEVDFQIAKPVDEFEKIVEGNTGLNLEEADELLSEMGASPPVEDKAELDLDALLEGQDY